MKRLSVVLAVLLALGAGAAARPAGAQSAGELVPPTIIRMGTHTSPVAGNGTVRVQVQINANGTHTVTKIISSTNHADDAAAREIAASSTYRPARRGGKIIPYFYDPVFRFTGTSVTNPAALQAGATDGGAGAADRVEGLIRSGQYDTAKSLAQSALQNNPNDTRMLQLLGVAEYYSHDFSDSAASFDRAGPIARLFAPIAAQAYAAAAVQLADVDTTHALAYAQRAIALDHGANSHFALGVAQLGAKEYAAAIQTLTGVHATVFADPHSDMQARYTVDQRLLAAYVGNGDLSAAQPTIDEMRRLEPSNPYPTQEVGKVYITQGLAAEQAHNADQALALYDRAAALGDPMISGAAYDHAASVVANESPANPARVKAYADKALALNANDPLANMFEGVALIEQYNTARNADTKQQALTYLNKADALAKAAGNQTLAQSIEREITQLNAAGSGMP